MTIKCTILLADRNDVNPTAPYRPHQVLKLMTTTQQSRQTLSMQLKGWLIPLIPLHSAVLTILSMLVPLHTESSVYIAWVNAFITAMLCAVDEAGDARSALRFISGIYSLASTLFSVITASSVKDKDLLQPRIDGYVRQSDLVPAT